GPIVAVPLFQPAYHNVFVDNVLPALYGLTLSPTYLAMALALVAAMFGVRAADGAPRAGLAAGLMAAAAIPCFPPSARVAVRGVAVGVLLALVIATRWHALLEAAAGLAAGLAPTLIWRHRAGVATFTLGHPTWSGFQGSWANVRENFYSNRLVQWLPVAGAIG